MFNNLSHLPTIIIGGGPVGLAAAAQLLERGIEPLILEQGNSVGHAIRQWAHVRMFSPWSYNVDEAARKLLKKHGWKAPCGTGFPTGGELVDKYLEPLAAIPEIKSRLHFQQRVTAIARAGIGKVRTQGRESLPFEVHAINNEGKVTIFLARAVIDSSGTWGQPNPAGANGLFAPGEKENGTHITYGMPDVSGTRHTQYKGKRVAVLGSGHSAIGTLLDLAKLQGEVSSPKITWLVRKSQLSRVYGGGAKDKLLERGALGARLKDLVEAGHIDLEKEFSLSHIDRNENGALLIHSTDNRVISVDELIVATGARPNLDMLREIRLGLDSALECPSVLAPLIDPNLHSCGTVRPHGALQLSHPEQDFYIAGMKSYGRAPTFLLATGYEQVRSIAAWLAGDIEAANRVELNLPETGVCNTDRSDEPITVKKVELTQETSKSSCCNVAA